MWCFSAINVASDYYSLWGETLLCHNSCRISIVYWWNIQNNRLFTYFYTMSTTHIKPISRSSATLTKVYLPFLDQVSGFPQYPVLIRQNILCMWTNHGRDFSSHECSIITQKNIFHA